MKISCFMVILISLVITGCSKEERCKFLTSNAGLQCASFGKESELDKNTCSKAMVDAYDSCQKELGSLGIDHYCTHMGKLDYRCPNNEYNNLFKKK